MDTFEQIIAANYGETELLAATRRQIDAYVHQSSVFVYDQQVYRQRAAELMGANDGDI